MDNESTALPGTGSAAGRDVVDIAGRTARALEWRRLKEFLAAEAVSPWGKEKCLTLSADAGPEVADILLSETDEVLSLLEARTPLALEGLPDARETLSRLRAGAVLSPEELLEIRAVLLLARRSRASLTLLDRQSFPRLSALAPGLYSLEELAGAIDAAIDEHGEIKDSASETLAALRREVRAVERQIKEQLQRLINSAEVSKSLQEQLYTQRNGRYVLPVNASMRQAVQGIVHDSSASGLTVYVEPISVVEMGNKMRLTETEIEREVARILEALSQACRSHVDEINSSLETLVELDFISARARLAQRYRGTRPEISRGGMLRLRAARHPLLLLLDPARAAAIVANDIALDPAQRTLVVTGPNTGGKTVLLKTAGLLSCMVRAGLLLPVAAGSSAVVFEGVYADIGDEQSLAQNLSTFSSHMTNIVEVVRLSRPGCLVLLDEIGAGTDPREGAALATAVLEHLNRSGAYTITTTHFGELKTLAYTTDGFVNASLEFDEETLSPTYRLRMGVPGSSKATAIASRLGLPAALVDAAEELLAGKAEQVQTAIERLERKIEELARKEEEAEQASARARATEEAAQARLAEAESDRRELRERLAAEMEADVRRAKEQVRAIIAELQRQPTSRRAQEAAAEMERVRDELGWLEPPALEVPAEVSRGQRVRVRSINQTGVVETIGEKPDGERQVTVLVGNVRLKVSPGDLEVLPAVPADRKAGRKPAGAARGGSPAKEKGRSGRGPELFVRSAGNTLDLRGERVEEALAKLERFLDGAYLSGGGPLMVIHGHGTGALKSAVRAYLSQSSYAAGFRPGESFEGGDGVTVVDFT